MSLRNSEIRNVHGGYGGLNAHGIYLARIKQSVLVNATAVNSVEAQSAPPIFYYAYYGDDGGSATGLTIDDVESGSITGTSIWYVVGGDATDNGCEGCEDLSGGSASGIVLQRSAVDLVHNTIAATSSGLRGSPNSQDGVSYGILSDGGDVHVAATVIARHMYGLTNQAGIMSIDQISLWENNIDYNGVSPSPTDLHINPGWLTSKMVMFTCGRIQG